MGHEDPAISACTLTETSVTRFGLGFSTNYSRLQTEKVQNELEGGRAGGLYLFCSFFLHKFFRTVICPPEPCFFFFFRCPPRRFVVTAVFSVRSPCTWFIAVAFVVFFRLSARYPAAFQLFNSQRNMFSCLFPPFFPPHVP